MYSKRLGAGRLERRRLGGGYPCVRTDGGKQDSAALLSGVQHQNG